LVGMVGLLLGTIPAGYGLPPWISIVAGIAVLFATLKVIGRRAEA